MEHKIQKEIPVRFSDLDALGHVNNAVYFTYMEEGRMEYFKQFPNMNFKGLPKASFILADIACQFKSPAFLGETIGVKLRTTEIKNSSFIMEYRLEEKTSGRLVATGSSVQVYFDYQNKKSIPLTPELKKTFEKIEEKRF